MAQIIIIRGNSGSGKSSLAKNVRDQIDDKVALIEQDYFRRIILKEKDDKQNTDIIDFLVQSIQLSIKLGYTVIIEGILNSQKYGALLHGLTGEYRCLAFYMDVSFEETLRRHQTKPNSHEFGYQEIKDWFLANDYLNIKNEYIIPEKSSLTDSVKIVVERYKASLELA